VGRDLINKTGKCGVISAIQYILLKSYFYDKKNQVFVIFNFRPVFLTGYSVKSAKNIFQKQPVFYKN
jgi:hypothetical protein